MENIITEIANSYNELPYASSVFKNSSIERLSALAKLRGLNPPDIKTAKVLEIGCSYGGNLFPTAILNPNSHCIGVDLSEHQITIANRIKNLLNLENIEFYTGDISQARFNIKFDYIICHGVFSWVPDSVADAILQVAQNNLTENGLMYLSYNIRPSWNSRITLRDIMLSIKNKNLSKLGQARHGLEYLKYISEKSAIPNIKELYESVADKNLDYIYHEYLESFNKPYYFKEFAEKIAQFNLAYVDDAALPEYYPYEELNKFKELSNSKSKIDFIQFMDYCRNAQFRCSILCLQNNALAHGLIDDSEQIYVSHNLDKIYIQADIIEKDNAWNVEDFDHINFNKNEINDFIFNMLRDATKPLLTADILKAAHKKIKNLNEQSFFIAMLILTRCRNVFLSTIDSEISKVPAKPKINQKIRDYLKIVSSNEKIVSPFSIFNENIYINNLIIHVIDKFDGTKNKKQLYEEILEDFNNGALNSDFADKEKLAKDLLNEALLIAEKAGYFNKKLN